MTETPQTFDTLLTGATILTADPTRPLLRDGCVGVRDGRIAWLDQREPEAAQVTRRIDARGHLVTPGFVNLHLHAILTMVRGIASDEGFAPSYTPGIPKGTDLTPDQARALARLGALDAMLFGSTLIGDNFVHADIGVEVMEEMGLRLAPSWRIHDVDFGRVAGGEWHFDHKIGEQTLTAAIDLHDRWKDHPRIEVNLAAHAADTCSEPFLREIADVAHQRGLRINTHLGQSTAEVDRVQERTGKSSTQVFEDAGLLNDRFLGGHCIYVTDDDIARMARAGAHVVHIPKANAASGRFAPTPKFRDAGLNMAIATDTQHGDMIELMRWALVTGRVQQGGVSDDWQPSHVFDMATINGARALGQDDQIGSLEVGKQADLVMLDIRHPHQVPQISPLGNLVHTAHGRDVRLVMVVGDILIEDGRPTKVDAEEICREAEAVSRQVWGDVGRCYWES
ncbi:amidohydrolase family protein [Oceanibium sediminis]|uniref:amidohydrolase family protein n=1 Tax=Oceanibium sediminis TaxID=2026339 RepID=UPI000DD47760|nr:amidohydrolase family protein [Oceanibium sediminis]